MAVHLNSTSFIYQILADKSMCFYFKVQVKSILHLKMPLRFTVLQKFQGHF